MNKGAETVGNQLRVDNGSEKKTFEQSQFSKIESLKLKLHADIQAANSPLLIYQKDPKSISEAIGHLCRVQKDAFRLNHALIALRQYRKSL